MEGGDLNLWTFRRIAARKNFVDGAYVSDITLVNWPMIDYFEGPVIDVPDAADHLQRARDLSRCFFYWMQTEAPRPDGGTGFPGLRTARRRHRRRRRARHGALHPREPAHPGPPTPSSSRTSALAVRGDRGAVSYPDSVGIGMYRIDLHPSTGGDNYIDVGASPFEIPLGALLPQRLTNLIAAGKNIGTTHITNGCYRLHPVEWNVGEVAGALAAFCLDRGIRSAQVHERTDDLAAFQQRLVAAGVELHWPQVTGY